VIIKRPNNDPNESFFQAPPFQPVACRAYS
jgi:hypothetical protein